NATAGPQMSHLHWAGRREELNALVLNAVRWVFFPSLAVTIALAAFGRTILGVFGAEFRAGWAALVVYSIGQLVSVSAGPVGILLNMTGQHRITAAVNATCAALTFIGYLILIPWHGMIGAALAVAVGVGVKNIWLTIVAERRLDYRISLLRAIRPSGFRASI
ncbi:MAG: polysaccharide biosynthesis C-terminal domain-containing protein, partial [Acidimicrobiales bacterium]